MPILSITNQVASQALRGQNVKVTVDLTTQSSEFSQLQVGQLCVCASSEGYVYSVDNFGNTFEVSPRTPNDNFSVNGAEGSVGGYFDSGNDVDITI